MARDPEQKSTTEQAWLRMAAPQFGGKLVGLLFGKSLSPEIIDDALTLQAAMVVAQEIGANQQNNPRTNQPEQRRVSGNGKTRLTDDDVVVEIYGKLIKQSTLPEWATTRLIGVDREDERVFPAALSSAIRQEIAVKKENLGAGGRVPNGVPGLGDLWDIPDNLNNLAYSIQYLGRIQEMLAGRVSGENLTLNKPQGFSRPNFNIGPIPEPLERAMRIVDAAITATCGADAKGFPDQPDEVFTQRLNTYLDTPDEAGTTPRQSLEQAQKDLRTFGRELLAEADVKSALTAPALRQARRALGAPPRFNIPPRLLSNIGNILPLVYTGINIAALLTAKFLCAVPVAVGAATLITHSLPFALLGLLVAALGIYKAARILAHARNIVNEPTDKGAAPANNWLGADSKISRFYRANKRNLHRVGGLLIFVTSASTAAFASLNLLGALGGPHWLPQNCPPDSANTGNPPPAEIPRAPQGAEAAGGGAGMTEAAPPGQPPAGPPTEPPPIEAAPVEAPPAIMTEYANGMPLAEVAVARAALDTADAARSALVLPPDVQTFSAMGGNGQPVVLFESAAGNLTVPAAQAAEVSNALRMGESLAQIGARTAVSAFVPAL